MPITRDTPFRDVGPISYELWHDPIAQAGGRAELASRAAHTAAGKHSAILRRLLKQESSYDTDYAANSKANNNPYNIRVPDYSNEGNPKGYIHFANLVDATDAARRRINGDAGFFDGPNPYAAAVTIKDLLYTYAPPKWNDTEGLISAMVRDLNAWLPQWSPPVSTPSTSPEPIPGEGDPVADLVFGRVPKPPMKVMIVPKGASGQTGWFQCPPRHNVGFMAHETQGTSSGEWYYDFFSCPNGERCKDALVDFLIDPQGVIYMFNDPEGTRAPWANGGGALQSGGLEGDGVAYVDYFGLGAVDTKTISCEIVKNHGAPMTAKQIVSLGKLFAYYADRDQQPYTNWPAIAKYGGTRVYLNHFEIGTTNCFINPDDNDKVIAEVQKNLKAGQADGITPAEPVYVEADPMESGTFVKNDRLFLEVNKDYTTQRPVKPFRYADFKPEQQTGPELPKGTRVKVLHVVSDTGASSDLTLEIDAVKVGDETVPKGSRIDGRVIA